MLTSPPSASVLLARITGLAYMGFNFFLGDGHCILALKSHKQFLKKENAKAAHATGSTYVHISIVQTLSSRLEPGKAGRRRENVIPPGFSLAANRHAAQMLFAD